MRTVRSTAASERSCVGCRQTDTRDALLRFVLAGEPPALLPDVRRRAPGRGVSVHPRRACLRSAVKRGGFRRALRCELALDADALARCASDQYRKRLDSLLQAAQRAGVLAVGTEATRTAVRDRKAELLLVAEDAEGRRRELSERAERLGRRCLVMANKNHLGGLLARSEVGVVAVLDAGFARALLEAADRAASLAEDA